MLVPMRCARMAIIKCVLVMARDRERDRHAHTQGERERERERERREMGPHRRTIGLKDKRESKICWNSQAVTQHTDQTSRDKDRETD